MGVKRRKQGQTLVEAALVLTILLFIALMIIQYGIIMNVHVTVTHLAREGARYAAVNPDEDARIRNYIISNAPPTINTSRLAITISPPQGHVDRVRGKPITVIIQYDMRDRMFLPSSFFGVPLPGTIVTARATMLIE